MSAITISLDPVGTLTDEVFYQLCRANPDVKFERSAQGELVIMSPTGGKAVAATQISPSIWASGIAKLSWATPSTRLPALSCPMGPSDRLMPHGSSAAVGRL